MSASPGSAATGILLIVAGVWLLLQTLVADLPSRIVKLGSTNSSSGSSDSSTPVSPSTPAASAAPDAPRLAPLPPAKTGKPQPPINLGPGSGQATIPSIGGGPPAPTF